MHPSTRFDAYVSEARQVVSRLSAHDKDCNDALSTGSISGALEASVQLAVDALAIAYGELGDDLMLRCALPTSVVRYRLPVFKDFSAEHPAGARDLMDLLRESRPEFAAKVRNHLQVATVDGWLRPLVFLAESPAQMNLRRAVAEVSVSNSLDGAFEMDLRSEAGESIPMFAPVLLEENSHAFIDIKRGYYLAVLPEAREVVSFLDRCVRGMSSLRKGLNEEFASFGY